MLLPPKPLFWPHPWMIPLCILMLVVFVAYSNIFDAAFVFDDPLLIGMNSALLGNLGDLFSLSTTGGAQVGGGFYRPIQMVLYALIKQTWGDSTVAFHSLNLFLHSLNVGMVFVLARWLGVRSGVAFLAALLWGVHPIHTEAVTYISGTADPLFTFFTLAMIMVLLPDLAWWRVGCAMVLLAGALLSKETAVVAPALATLVYGASARSSVSGRKLLRLWPLWGMAILYAVWRMNAAQFDGPVTYERLYAMPDYANLALYAKNFGYRVITFLATLPYYGSLLLWPNPLYMERDFPVYVGFAAWPPVLGLGMVVCVEVIWGVAGWAIGQRMRSKDNAISVPPWINGLVIPLAFGLMWFAIAHAPNTGLLVAVNAIFLEHWMYMPTIGLFLGVAVALAYIYDRWLISWQRCLILGVALVLVILMVVRSYQQNLVWQSPITFYLHMFQYTQKSSRAHNNLGIAYVDKGETQKAIEQFRLSTRVSDVYAETHYNWALALIASSAGVTREGRQEAILHLKRAIELDPGFFRAYGRLAILYHQLGDAQTAEHYAQEYHRLTSR